jgi:CubicO group peptidase (beta-lactamase class C family)
MHSTPFITENRDLATAVDLFDKWIALDRHNRQLPGIAVGIVHNGELVWGKGYGFANLEQRTPVTIDTRFRIASITKSFTATAIMQLRDAGKLRLDDPVRQHVDWFDLRYEGAPEITIRHLLTHTSGLPRDANIAHWTDNVFQDWDEVIRTTHERRPTMPPEQEFSYSNLGYSLLGAVIETVSGEAWEAYIQRHILDPLGMDKTVVALRGNEADVATGYLRYDEEYQRQAAPFAETRGFSASASMASSIRDLAKYAHFHMNPGTTPILSGHSLREMHRVHWLERDWQSGYGLGLRVQRVQDWEISGHGGGYKGYITYFSVCRAHQTAIIALTNAIDGLPTNVTTQGYKLILPEIIKITVTAPQPADHWQQLVGTYLNDWGNSEVVVRGGTLQAVWLEAIDAPPMILEPTEDPYTFTIKVPGNPGETVRFERDASGQVVRMWMRNEYAIPKRG